MGLHPVDICIIAGYFVFVIGVGLYVERRAGQNLESYFLASGKLPWWVLGMSGSSTFFDIAGTMWMVSVFYVLGMRGLWVHWMWGLPFAAFYMSYMGKWAYRSGVLTDMEWLVFRFGQGPAGQAARLMSIVIALTVMVLMLGYAGTGVGKFLGEFLPVSEDVAVPILFLVTGLYVVLGGFFGVAYSDFFQTVLLSFASVYIAIAAFLQIDYEGFRAAVGSDWFSVAPVMNSPQSPKEYPDPFGLLVILWVTKGILGLLGAVPGVTFQRVRAARDEAEASKMGLVWGLVMSVRWSLVIAFTAFGLSIFAANGEAVDSEMVLPMVLNQLLPVGVKGVVIAGLLAAFMSTFDSGLNVAASYVVNDLVKPVWKHATPKGLVWVGYGATMVFIVLGIVISLHTERIAEIWNPINFALGAALLAPRLFAPYWWRIGGAALCVSGAITLPAALCIKLFTDWRELQYFPVLAATSFVSCIAAAFIFPPAPDKALMDYYRKVRPFGFWGPVRRMLEANGEAAGRFERDRYDIPVVLVGSTFFVMLYLMMMDLVLHNWVRLAWLSVGTTACCVFFYFFWWRPLGGKLSPKPRDSCTIKRE